MRNCRTDSAVIERAFVPALFVAVAAGAILLGRLVSDNTGLSLTFTFLFKQDLWLVLAGIVVLSISLYWLPARQSLPAMGTKALLVSVTVMATAVLAGRHFVLLNYDMSRDEQMASFDALIFSTGRLVAPLGEPWNVHAEALNTLFMLPIQDRDAWVSGYLPMNSAIRGVFELVGAANLVGPLAVLIGAMALWACARKIWPNDPSAAVLALILYMGSGQVLVNGMTAYAMPLHLAANVVWLWLFIQNRLRMDLLALCVGFVAVGLHQPVFHPLFALPILIGLVIERDWRRSAIFFFGYLAVGAFWFWWPSFSAGLVGGASAGGGGGYASNLAMELLRGWPSGFGDMIANVVRFFAWQHLLLLPLILIGTFAIVKDRLMAGLAGGIVLTFIIVAIVVPYQGHGFGYRYLHGLIGNAILLAVLGWQKVRGDFPQWNSLILRVTVGGFLVILPMQLSFAHQFYSPFAQASRAIDESRADYVLVNSQSAPFANDLVFNDPFLRNRPIRLLEDQADAALLGELCKNGASVSRLDAKHYNGIWMYFTGASFERTAFKNEELSTMIRESGCRLQ